MAGKRPAVPGLTDEWAQRQLVLPGAMGWCTPYCVEPCSKACEDRPAARDNETITEART